MGANAWATLAALVASLGAFLAGLDIGYIAPILECGPFKRDVAHLPNWQDPRSKIPSGTAGFMVGIFSIGCIMTSFPAVSGHFLDVWGRRASLMAGSAVFLVGSCLQARAMSIEVMLFGRLVTGGAIGLLSSVVPLYQAEMAPPHLRGALTSLYQLMITLGILVAAFADQLLVGHENGWRVAIWLQTVPAVLILAAMPCLPRSPRWLVQQGRRQEALRTLCDIRSQDVAPEELSEIIAEHQASETLGRPGWAELCRGRVARLLLLGAALQFLQQMQGMNAFMYFGPRIFGSVGLNQNLFQTINNAVNFAATFPALYLVDRSGRRLLLILGAVVMTGACVVMGLLGVKYMKREGEDWVPTRDGVGGLMAAMVFAFVMSFACTWGPVVWLYCVEIFPLRYRGLCVGVTTLTNWVGNYLIAQFTPVLLDVLGFSTFFIFAVFCAISLCLALWLPETKGVLLEHIGSLFDAKFGVVDSGLSKKGGAESYGAVATLEQGGGKISA